ncbi:bifunctional 2-polyprenyl-6-hydroxyphenol methylase/3-demethylubiquinol 3-O-methyltransferase UbiG [Maritimibacter sp. DP1N21-5]|uniref:class I SAM-dependent methyltransferase n=1 Tax=Maritimibacter sp. DP1N21-5 TaxID=2836867 RepID=UPI002102B2E6|nr:class I SAM-dependent methyltransferase [Maritimibacter sp. DP1N21-5]
MGYDYDALYGKMRDALGAPTPFIADFLARIDLAGARVLDVGCGQGRDALMIARQGAEVVGVDLSPNGIRDLQAAAQAEGLRIDGIVADITSYRASGLFDVILIDRTLHMLPDGPRLDVLKGLLDHVAEGGWLLIADEPSNVPAMGTALEEHGGWSNEIQSDGYLFARRTG